MRTPDGAWTTTARLLEKACERMRHLGFHARSMAVQVKSQDGQWWDDHATITPSADTWTFMEVLTNLWNPGFRMPMKVGVVLYDLVPSENVTLPLFDDQARRNRATEAVDRLNSRFGRTRVTLACAMKAESAVEDKIAFGKVQEMD
jgi:DNA polymerase-4